ncbi:hypothetical protein [Hydrogenophaga sp.]|uniref:hypothetical protein n=1 Tax=Hydrogenophaga sp. TaxID=1904254 RepID=UPI003D09D7E1
MSIQRLNQGEPNSASQVPFYDTANGQDRRASLGDVLINAMPLVSSGAAGLAPATGGGTTNFLRADGTWAAPPGGGGGVSDGDKGDITVSGGGATWEVNAGLDAAKLANGTVSNAEFQYLGGVTSDIQTQLNAKASTAVVTSGANGLAPASGGGTTNFLRADGTWAAPPGGGGGVSDGDKGDITVSGGGTVWTIDAGLDAAKLADGSVSNTELQYLNSVTSNVQTQLDSKLGAGSATPVSNTKAVPVDADPAFVEDSEASNELKKTTIGGIRTRLNTTPIGTALGTTGAVNLDFAALVGTLQTIAATGDITFTASNMAAGRSFELEIVAGAADRDLVYPAAWVELGQALPLILLAGEILCIALRSNGTTEASVRAAGAVSV